MLIFKETCKKCVIAVKIYIFWIRGDLPSGGVSIRGGSPCRGGSPSGGFSIWGFLHPGGFSIHGGDSPSGGVLHPGGSPYRGGVPCDISHHAFNVTCMLPPHQLRHINSAPAYILLPGHVTCKACWDTHPPLWTDTHL